MPPGSTLFTALLITAAIGAVLTVLLLRVRRPRLETEAGIRTLAAMRWREFSNLVIEALHAQGYESEPVEESAERGQQADLVLRRGGENWLLSCKQGAHYRVTPEVVAEVADAVRFNGAAGGVIATPGTIDPKARAAKLGIELIDGATLWPLVRPLLSEGVREELANEARQQTGRGLVAGWVLALAMGLVGAWLLRDGAPADATPGAASAPAATTSTTATPTVSPPVDPTPVAPAPIGEDEQRAEVIRTIGDLPGIDKAVWSTRSTLLVYLDSDDGSDRLREICAVLERYETLRASRLQLQPPAGSERAVRFLQCRVF